MKLSIVRKFPKLANWLSNQVGYFGDQFFQINEDGFAPSASEPRLAIVSRKHYKESWKSYPSISHTELSNILNLQTPADSDTRFIHKITESIDKDGFDVKTIEFSNTVNSKVSPQIVLLPETELLAVRESKNREILDIKTPIAELFCAMSNGKSQSAFKNNLLKDVHAFKLSIGYPDSTNIKSLNQSDYAKYLLDSLLECDFKNLIKVVSVNVRSLLDTRRLHMLYWGPVLSALIFVLATNTYYYIQNQNLNAQLESYDSTVNELLQMQRTQNESQAFIDIVSQEFEQIRPAHKNWNVVYQVVSAGMHVQQFRKRDSRYLLRGNADDASNILSVLNELPNVSNASFEGVVRKSRGKDSFVIQFEITEES